MTAVLSYSLVSDPMMGKEGRCEEMNCPLMNFTSLVSPK